MDEAQTTCSVRAWFKLVNVICWRSAPEVGQVKDKEGQGGGENTASLNLETFGHTTPRDLSRMVFLCSDVAAGATVGRVFSVPEERDATDAVEISYGLSWVSPESHDKEKKAWIQGTTNDSQTWPGCGM